MEKCFMCGSNGDFDAIYNQEMVGVCRVCAQKAGIPVIRKPSEEQLQAIEKPRTVQERLARMAGIQPKQAAIPAREEVKRYIEKAKPEELKRLNLIDNFNWHLARARRARGLTVRQLALSVQEPEKSVVQLEQGYLPSDALKVIEKIENYLKIPLRNKGEGKSQMVRIVGVKDNLIGKEIEIEDEEL